MTTMFSLTAKQVLSENVTIGICQGNSQTFRIYRQKGQIMMRAYAQKDGVTWLNTAAKENVTAEGNDYINIRGEQEVRVFLAKDRKFCSISIGKSPVERGTMEGTSMSNTSFVRGSLTYLQRIALPPRAEISIKLLDVSLQDVAAEVISEQIITTSGEQVPIRFQLRYDPQEIKPNHSYAVQASIRVNDQLTFTTTRRYAVITMGSPLTVDLILDPVARKNLYQELKQGEWLLEDLAGSGVLDSLQTRLKFEQEERLNGLGGCNLYFANYKLNGENIKVGIIASTQKACSPAVMNQEDRYLKALQQAYRLRLDGPYLLIDCQGLKQPLKFTRIKEGKREY